MMHFSQNGPQYAQNKYTDEAEHQAEIQRLWENRRKRLEQGLTR